MAAKCSKLRMVMVWWWMIWCSLGCSADSRDGQMLNVKKVEGLNEDESKGRRLCWRPSWQMPITMEVKGKAWSNGLRGKQMRKDKIWGQGEVLSQGSGFCQVVRWDSERDKNLKHKTDKSFRQNLPGKHCGSNVHQIRIWWKISKINLLNQK